MGISWMFVTFLDFGLFLRLERRKIFWKSCLFHSFVSLCHDFCLDDQRSHFTWSYEWIVLLHQT